MITQIMAVVTADLNFVLNQDLNKGLLCSIKMQGVDVKNIRITVVTVKKRKRYLEMCGIFPHIFYIIVLFHNPGTFYTDKCSNM